MTSSVDELRQKALESVGTALSSYDGSSLGDNHWLRAAAEYMLFIDHRSFEEFVVSGNSFSAENQARLAIVVDTVDRVTIDWFDPHDHIGLRIAHVTDFIEATNAPL